MSEYRTVEGELGAVNVLTGLTTFGTETAVGPVKVPAAASAITEIWSAFGAHVDTAGDNAAVVLRLSGKGMAQGDQDFILSGAGGGVTNTGSVVDPAHIYPVDIPVVANETITVQVMAVGDDVLIGTQGITLRFD